ncbi:TPA: FitA-like ribbon-helix-helix domain-containing protein [Serratia marcescens]
MQKDTLNLNSERKATITVRNIPTDVDDAISRQAKAAGRSKSDFVQEFLSATFGDLIGNFIRTSELVALMDKEVARIMDCTLSTGWFEHGVSPATNREYCRLLGILNEAELQRIMMASVPFLEVRARQLQEGIPLVPHGVSLRFALFIEAASRDLPTLLRFHRALYYIMDEKHFLAEIAEIREARRLLPLEIPEF